LQTLSQVLDFLGHDRVAEQPSAHEHDLLLSKTQTRHTRVILRLAIGTVSRSVVVGLGAIAVFVGERVDEPCCTAQGTQHRTRVHDLLDACQSKGVVASCDADDLAGDFKDTLGDVHGAVVVPADAAVVSLGDGDVLLDVVAEELLTGSTRRISIAALVWCVGWWGRNVLGNRRRWHDAQMLADKEVRCSEVLKRRICSGDMRSVVVGWDVDDDRQSGRKS
jgi:hypothetical protein